MKFENLKNMNAPFQYRTLATRENFVDRVGNWCSLTQSIGCGLRESMSKVKI